MARQPPWLPSPSDAIRHFHAGCWLPSSAAAFAIIPRRYAAAATPDIIAAMLFIIDIFIIMIRHFDRLSLLPMLLSIRHAAAAAHPNTTTSGPIPPDIDITDDIYRYHAFFRTPACFRQVSMLIHFLLRGYYACSHHAFQQHIYADEHAHASPSSHTCLVPRAYQAARCCSRHSRRCLSRRAPRHNACASHEECTREKTAARHAAPLFAVCSVPMPALRVERHAARSACKRRQQRRAL
jgi:hypothetical protein